MAEIDKIIAKLKKGALVSSSFNLMGELPNFSRDALSGTTELSAITKADHIYDVGHIVYCQENGKHYVFRGRSCNTEGGEDETKWIGQFQELSFTGEGGGSTLLFNFKGSTESFNSITNSEKGDAYSVAVDNYVIPSGSSYNGTEITASTGDMIICVIDEPEPKWSLIKNNVNLAGYVKKGIDIYHRGDIPVFNNDSGGEIISSDINANDVIVIGKSNNTTTADVENLRGAILYDENPAQTVPMLDEDHKIIDSQVRISVLRNLQKELGGVSAFTFSDQDEIQKGTLADMIQQFRENNNQLGHSYGVVSATTEVEFVKQMQNQLSASTTDQGFVLPITIFPTEDPKTPYLFDEFIPVEKRTENQQVIEERYPLTVEATVRKDGSTPNNSGTAFHLDFEIAKYSLQYWYNGAYDNDSDGNIDRFDSVLYFEEYGMSNNLNLPQENNETQEEP